MKRSDRKKRKECVEAEERGDHATAQKLRAELDAPKNLAIKAGKIVFIAGVGFVVTSATGGVGLIPYVSGLAASTGAAIVLDGQVQEKIAIGDYSGAADQATYHLPGLGSSRSLVEALIEGNTLGALVSAGSVGLDVLPFIKIGKLPGSKADALGLANKTGSGAQQQRLAATTNGKGNGNHGQQSNPNKKSPAEGNHGGENNTQQRSYTKQSGKNEKHSNLDKRNAAQEKVKNLQQELEELTNMPRTDETRARIDYLKKQIKHHRKKADESGGTHSRKTKKKK